MESKVPDRSVDQKWNFVGSFGLGVREMLRVCVGRWWGWLAVIVVVNRCSMMVESIPSSVFVWRAQQICEGGGLLPFSVTQSQGGQWGSRHPVGAIVCCCC